MKNTVVAQMRKKNTAITGYLKKIKNILWSEYHAPIPVTGISSHLFREVSLNSNHELRVQRNSVCIYVDQV